jgi:hypothetical protein
MPATKTIFAVSVVSGANMRVLVGAEVGFNRPRPTDFGTATIR